MAIRISLTDHWRLSRQRGLELSPLLQLQRALQLGLDLLEHLVRRPLSGDLRHEPICDGHAHLQNVAALSILGDQIGRGPFPRLVLLGDRLGRPLVDAFQRRVNRRINEYDHEDVSDLVASAIGYSADRRTSDVYHAARSALHRLSVAPRT